MWTGQNVIRLCVCWGWHVFMWTVV